MMQRKDALLLIIKDSSNNKLYSTYDSDSKKMLLKVKNFLKKVE